MAPEPLLVLVPTPPSYCDHVRQPEVGHPSASGLDTARDGTLHGPGLGTSPPRVGQHPAQGTARSGVRHHTAQSWAPHIPGLGT
eukprot:362927-Chlamydomonas_euryale.AAC.15